MFQKVNIQLTSLNGTMNIFTIMGSVQVEQSLQDILPSMLKMEFIPQRV